MIIKTINRVISDGNYGNLSASAELDENDKLEESFKKLDSELRKSLTITWNKLNRVRDIHAEADKSISILESALAHAKKAHDDLPF